MEDLNEDGGSTATLSPDDTLEDRTVSKVSPISGAPVRAYQTPLWVYVDDASGQMVAEFPEYDTIVMRDMRDDAINAATAKVLHYVNGCKNNKIAPKVTRDHGKTMPDNAEERVIAIA